MPWGWDGPLEALRRRAGIIKEKEVPSGRVGSGGDREVAGSVPVLEKDLQAEPHHSVLWSLLSQAKTEPGQKASWFVLSTHILFPPNLEPWQTGFGGPVGHRCKLGSWSAAPLSPGGLDTAQDVANQPAACRA